MRHPHISRDPDIMMGKPVVRGTRITVEIILRKLGEGRTVPELLDDWPHVTHEQIQAALAFAADYLSHESTLSDAAAE